MVCPARSGNRVRERVRAQRPRATSAKKWVINYQCYLCFSPLSSIILPVFPSATEEAGQTTARTFFLCLHPMASDSGSFRASAGTRYKIEFDQANGFCMSFAKRKITGLLVPLCAESVCCRGVPFRHLYSRKLSLGSGLTWLSLL